MEFPKNAESYPRSRAIPKKVDRKNFYSHPGDQCKLDAYLDPNNTRVFSNAVGVSPTIQGIMRVSTTAKELFALTGGDMFMKSFPEILATQQHGRYDASLAMEVFILRYLAYFKTFRISPCIQQYYTDFVCSESSDRISTKIFEQYRAMRVAKMHHEPGFSAASPRMRYVMTEFIPGKSVKNSITSLNEQDIKQILFQVFYTCDQFHLAGVRHNDIHSDNVFLKPIKPTTMYFFTPQGIVVLEKCRYLVKVIDYDQSVFYDQEEWILENQKYVQNKTRCPMAGICSVGANPKKDQVLFLTFMVDDMRRSGIRSPFIERFSSGASSDPTQMIYEPYSIYKSGWIGHLCYNPRFDRRLPGTQFQYQNQGSCTNWIPSDDLFRPFSYMVQNQLFELLTIPFTPDNVERIPMEDAWISLSLNDEAYKKMMSLRKNIRKPLEPVVMNLPRVSPAPPAVKSKALPPAPIPIPSRFPVLPKPAKDLVIPPRALALRKATPKVRGGRETPASRSSARGSVDAMSIVQRTPPIDDDPMSL